MWRTRFRSIVSFAFLFVASLIFAGDLSAVTPVLYRFTGGTDGSHPQGTLIFDQAGNLYGTTSPNGNSTSACSPGGGGGCGTVFKLTPSNGGWVETTLYEFCSLPNCADGANPQSGLVFDSAGNLYGTTLIGGGGCAPGGCGVVFELSPTSSGWTETVLCSFYNAGGAFVGSWPYSGVIFDNAGNLYGTTSWGTVFELTHSSSGWTETTLHTFLGTNGDGMVPEGNLVFDAHGNLYGINYGAVYELSPNGSGGWNHNS